MIVHQLLSPTLVKCFNMRYELDLGFFPHSTLEQHDLDSHPILIKTTIKTTNKKYILLIKKNVYCLTK